MKQPICIGLVIIVMLVVLGVGLGQAQGLQDQADRRASDASAASVAGTAWFIEQVDSPDVGEHVSVAVHPETGVIYVSYYDADGGDLRLATRVGSGGNCGPNNSWECQLVDGQWGAGDVGQFNSIAIYPGGSSLQDRWRLGIAYYDATNHALKFAEYAYVTFPTPGYTWTISTIVTGSTGTFWSKPGMYASLMYSWDAVPCIAHHRDTNLIGGDSVEYARRVTSGGNCGPSNTWQCDTVNTGAGVGQYASLDVKSDAPWIAYYDADSGYPWVSHKGGMGWYDDIVDQPSLDTGKHVSLFLRVDESPRIAYYNVTNGTLEYALDGYPAGGNCGWDSGAGRYKWRCDEIEEIGTPTGYRPVSIAPGPIIAYQDASGGALAAVLKVARPVSALGTPAPPGNCGPSNDWRCDIVDSGGQARSVSLAVDSNGLMTIAYHKHRFALPDSTDSLKVAYQRRVVYLPLVLR